MLEKGKTHLESGEYTLAKSTFAQSKNYLESTLKVYESDTTQTMIETLDSLLADCETGLKAETLFQEGVTLYESGHYSAALSPLQEAQTLFQSINVDNKECTTLVQQCESRIETEKSQKEAGTLLNEGITYFEEQQYKRAKTKFEEALSVFTELQNEEKIAECKEWITSCEEVSKDEESLKIPTVIIGTLVTLLVTIIGLLQLRKRRIKDIHESELIFDSSE